MEDVVYVTGHKSPDTDTICSAIAYAQLKKHFNVNAVPVRLGKLNKETSFVLDYFGVKKPEYLSTVRTQVSDLDIDRICSISPDCSLKKAWEIMKKYDKGVLPVTDKKERLLGIISVSDIANSYINIPKKDVFLESHTPLKNIVETLSAELICGSGEDFSNPGKVAAAAMTPDEMEPFIEKNDVVFVGNRKDNQKKIIEAGSCCLIITCGSKVGDDIKKLAQERKCIIMVTPHDTFTAARLLYQSIPVSFAMTKDNIISFNINDFIDSIKDTMTKTRYRSYPIVDDDNKIKGFISRYHLIDQKRKKVILVDHGEKSQAVDGIEQSDVLEIIDHHRVGDIETASPIYYRAEPIGCTATIVFKFYHEKKVEIPKTTAGLLLAAILSDTLKFKSPTCTDFDKKAAEELARISGVNIDDFMLKMVDAASSLDGMTPEEIIKCDFKDFMFTDHKFGVGQINSTDKAYIKKIKPDILNQMNEMIQNEGYSAVVLMVTDIFKEESQLIFEETEKGFMEKAFSTPEDENSMVLKNVVSRKKQIVPKLSKALEI